MRDSLDHPLPISSQTTTALVRRLVSDYGCAYWRRYALAFALMAVSAGCTALTAYLIGQVINAAYVSRSMHGIVVLCISVIAIFAAKGIATYGHAVILARIGNRIQAGIVIVARDARYISIASTIE